MGPGLITGASDDDPSGIATYSQAGVQFGYSMGWTLLFTYPLMCAIQLSTPDGKGDGSRSRGKLSAGIIRWRSFTRLMGQFVLRPVLKALGWLATVVMAVANWHVGDMGD